jgi:ATP-binding cassette subfamily C protein LapB
MSNENPYSELDVSAKVAHVLARIAALQGVAVPVHRFAYVNETSDGVSLNDLYGEALIIALWQHRFDAGTVVQTDIMTVAKGSFPLLWLADDDQTVLVVRGRYAKSWLVETAEGHQEERLFSSLEGGKFYKLTTDIDENELSAQNKMSAKDWFAFAIRRHRSVFFEAVFGTFMLSVFGLMTAMYTMQVYDRVVPTQGFSTLWVLTIGVFMAIGFELLMKITRAKMVDRACKFIDTELSSVFFEKALDIRADKRPKTVGTFASQIRHFESVRSFMTSSTLFILADAPFALLFILVIYLLAGPVAYVPLAMIPVSLIVGLLIKNPIERYTSEHMEESNKKNGLLVEAIDGIESIKSSSAEWKMAARWKDLTQTIGVSELKSRLLSSISTSITQSIQQLTYVGIIAVGAYQIAEGNLTMGGLIACSIISGRALTPLTQIPNLIVQWKHAQISLGVLDTIMAMPSEHTEQRRVIPDKCQGVVEANKVLFAYEQNAPTIQVEKLTVRPGDRVAILGSVGSGKSTLIKLLSGLYQPEEGKIFLDNVDMSHIATEYVREHVGYLPQEVRLFNGTLRENLVLGLPSMSDSQIIHAASLTGLDVAIRNHPMGLEIPISEGGKGLSGGQRQLVGLTRLLLARPQVLLLDEPTASMDAQLETKVMKHLFEEMPDDASIVVVTHKSGILPFVNRVVVMESGKVVVDGPRDKVIEALNKQAAERKST